MNPSAPSSLVRPMMIGKIHRATITEADLHYVGSITVDADLLDAADLLPGQQVDVVDVTNGARLTTYVIPGERGSGTLCINGAAAHLVHAGDLVILIAYGMLADADARTYVPRVVFVDSANRIVDVGGEPGGVPDTAAGAAHVEPSGITVARYRTTAPASRGGEPPTVRDQIGNLAAHTARDQIANLVAGMAVGGRTSQAPRGGRVGPGGYPGPVTEQTTEQPGGPAAGAHEETDHLPEQVRVRSEKRQRLLDAGIDPYPVVLPVTATIASVRAEHEALEAGEETDVQVGVAGRVMYLRNTGKLCFVTLQDGEGNRLQAMLSKAAVGEEALAAFKSDVDLGDHLFVQGHVGKSRRGELSIFADSWRLAAKALRPLPKTYENEAGEEVALSEEGRVRRRHLDLIMRQGARDMLRTRATVVKSLRRALDERNFIEIETPMLQVQPGGAAARPFVTHMNAYDVDLYMRIAPELFLKRAVVGGVEKVFEINRNFRNEGADSTHSPEFSMLEAYEAYGSYDTMAELTRNLVQRAALDAFGTTTVTLEDGTEYDLGGDWANLSLFDSLSAALGEEVSPETPESVLEAHAERLDVDVAPHFTHGKTAEVLWEHLVGDHLYAPTFVRDFPVDTSPLTRAHRSRPGVVEKWDLYVRGFELATAYSELVDPVVQRERFAAQALAAAAGDAEAMVLDEDFLEAMEQGMPPAGGMGMGIDRLLMALTGHGIRETITFPLVKRR